MHLSSLRSCLFVVKLLKRENQNMTPLQLLTNFIEREREIFEACGFKQKIYSCQIIQMLKISVFWGETWFSAKTNVGVSYVRLGVKTSADPSGRASRLPVTGST